MIYIKSMKRITIFLTLFSLIAFSCEKIEKLEDDIVHKGFNPYIILQPADSVGLISNNSCEKPFPFPSDSLVLEEFEGKGNGFSQLLLDISPTLSAGCRMIYGLNPLCTISSSNFSIH